MKFLVDPQLPRRLAHVLTAANHDAVHTLDLPRRNLTPDDELLEICARANRILVTKTWNLQTHSFSSKNLRGCSSYRRAILRTTSSKDYFRHTFPRSPMRSSRACLSNWIDPACPSTPEPKHFVSGGRRPAATTESSRVAWRWRRLLSG
jgi:hypothetical protein